MKPQAHAGGDHLSKTEERRIREAALDRTIEASFPASDPPSTNPNPRSCDLEEDMVARDEEASED